MWLRALALQERVHARRLAEREERLRKLEEDKKRDEEVAAIAREAAMVRLLCLGGFPVVIPHVIVAHVQERVRRLAKERKAREMM
jgi:hypothetical protein